MVAMATTRYCGADECIPEHILVRVFVNSRLDSVMFANLRYSQERIFAVSSGHVGDTFVIFRR